MRFLIDESVSGVVVRRLQAAGIDIVTLTATERGSPDEHVLALANADDMVLITEDRDFGDLVVRRGLPVAAILLLELDKLSNAAEADRVFAVVTEERDTIEGHFVVIEPARLRRQPLPLRLRE